MCERPNLKNLLYWKKRAETDKKLSKRNYLVFVCCMDNDELENNYLNQDYWNFGYTYYESDNSLYGVARNETKFIELFNLNDICFKNTEFINEKIDNLQSNFIKHIKNILIKKKIQNINKDFE